MRTNNALKRQRASTFLLGEELPNDDNAVRYRIQQLLQILLNNVHRGCCPEAGPGNQCGHCPASLDVLAISRAIVLSFYELPFELQVNDKLDILCSWVRDEVRKCSHYAVQDILPYEMSYLMMNDDYNYLPPLDQWGDDVAHLLQPPSSHWCIRVKLLMHMGYRVTLLDFDDVARFARKELEVVCSDVSQFLCPTEGEDDIDETGNMNNQPSSRKVSGQYKCGGCMRRWWGAAYMVINEATQEYDILSEYTFPDCRRCETNENVELLRCKDNSSNSRRGYCQPVNPLCQPHSSRNGRDDERDNNVDTKMERTNIRKVSFVDELEMTAERMRQNWIQTSDRNELAHSMNEALATAPMASKIIVQNNINYAVKGSFLELRVITNMIEVLYRTGTITKFDIETSMSDLLVSIHTHIDKPIYDYFGEMFRVFADMQALTLVWLAESASKIKDDKCKYRIIKCALDSIKEAYGLDAVYSCFSDEDESNALYELLGNSKLVNLEDEFGYVSETEYSTDSSSDSSSDSDNAASDRGDNNNSNSGSNNEDINRQYNQDGFAISDTPRPQRYSYDYKLHPVSEPDDNSDDDESSESDTSSSESDTSSSKESLTRCKHSEDRPSYAWQ